MSHYNQTETKQQAYKNICMLRRTGWSLVTSFELTLLLLAVLLFLLSNFGFEVDRPLWVWLLA